MNVLKLDRTRGMSAAVVLLTVGCLTQGQLVKDTPEPAAIPAHQFAKLHALIKPQPGELRFQEIPWLIDV